MDVSFEDFLSYILQGTEDTYKMDGGIYLIGDRKLEGFRSHGVYQLQHRSLDAIMDIIPADIKKGVEVKEFKELNSIILSGALPQIDEIGYFIKSVDKVVPMITIEVIFLDMSKGHSVSTGISAGISDSAVRTGGNLFPGPNMRIGSGSLNYFLDNLKIGGKQIAHSRTLVLCSVLHSVQSFL